MRDRIPKIVILDFDGVVLESADIKTNAFRELFKDYPEHVEEIVEYHIKHGGVSRYKKFPHIYNNILKKPIDENKIEELSERFSDLVLQKMLKCSFVEGVQEFLEEYSRKSRLFIASGIPQEELEFLLKEGGLLKYFRGVYGTPATKPEIIENIINTEGVKKEEVVYVGDAISDYEDAKKIGVPFVARFDSSNEKNPFLGLKVPVIRDFNDLRSVLEQGDRI